MCRDVVRKAEVHLELNLTRDMKADKKSFYGQVSSKKGKCKATSEWARGPGDSGHGNGGSSGAFFTSLFTFPIALVNSLCKLTEAAFLYTYSMIDEILNLRFILTLQIHPIPSISFRKRNILLVKE